MRIGHGAGHDTMLDLAPLAGCEALLISAASLSSTLYVFGQVQVQKMLFSAMWSRA